MSIMAVAGLNGVVLSVELIDNLTRHGKFHGEQFITLIHVGVIFWLAVEIYGLRVKSDRLTDRNGTLADVIEAHERRIEDESR